MWPFRERKASATAAAIVMSNGQPVWSPRNYRAFATEGYTWNVVANQSINRVGDALAMVRWTQWNGKTEIESSPILDLLRRPNPKQTGAAYIKEKTAYRLISGNGYEERVTVGSQPRELYNLRPDRMCIIESTTGFPAAYEYRVGNSQPVRWEVDDKGVSDILHTKEFHPLNDWYGQSPFEAASWAVNQNNEANRWMQALLQNSARPSGALVSQESLGNEAFARLKAMIEDLFSGGKNAGRPMLLEGGVDWKQMGLSPVDAGVQDTRDASARSIALAFRVPPMLLGIPGDNTYSNMREARLGFWEDTIMPMAQTYADEWSNWLGVDIKPDFDHVPAIVDKKVMLWDMANASEDLTIDERRELKGYGPTKGGDTILVSAADIPLSDAGKVQEDEEEPEDTVDVAKALVYGEW